ncbi:GNAT family N-acetyltransferase [Fodinicola feengrottensis]|uniref:N-acetyltransferase domain-containing protein n=1 Tax=Fodinicola feengrottensis TaxID=435914 RepID=A0ABP4U0Q6_9ACTN|nr:GNAT family N-acetyltransferase [Fodinicola feengrottensis]
MDKYTVSRPTPDNAHEIYDLIAAYDTAVLGAPDVALADVVDDLASAEFDLTKDGWLVRDAAGQLVGHAMVHSKGGSDIFLAEVNARMGDAEVADLLWTAVQDRAGEIATELGHPGGLVDVGIHRADDTKRAFAQRHGFSPSTSYHRQRIDFEGTAFNDTGAAPEPPPGCTLHDGTTDRARREAYLIHQESFADHHDFVPIPYERWYAHHESSSTHDWTQLQVARLDDEPAAVVIGSDLFVEDEDCGYVATLGVRPKYRGLGLGRLLLVTAFAADAARGRKGTILHVDANNVTPALGLYTSVGMRTVLVIDAWQRRFTLA